VTESVSPESSPLLPAANAAALYNVPVVSPLVLLLTRNAPPMDAVALMLNTALLAVLLTDWPDTAPSVSV